MFFYVSSSEDSVEVASRCLNIAKLVCVRTGFFHLNKDRRSTQSSVKPVYGVVAVNRSPFSLPCKVANPSQERSLVYVAVKEIAIVARTC